MQVNSTFHPARYDAIRMFYIQYDISSRSKAEGFKENKDYVTYYIHKILRLEP